MFPTPRLCCRRRGLGDLDAIHAVYGGALAVRWVGDGTPATREGCAQRLQATERSCAPRGYDMIAFEALDTSTAAGSCGLWRPGGQPEVEVKCALLRECEGQLLATEALVARLAMRLKRGGCGASAPPRRSKAGRRSTCAAKWARVSALCATMAKAAGAASSSGRRRIGAVRPAGRRRSSG
ncbi:MAG: GNAT family N-acetyltransferase, partial [Rubrivivax sp.]|nr:GNAT family N-acetyltransferase [Rubrivivax sp.]